LIVKENNAKGGLGIMGMRDRFSIIFGETTLPNTKRHRERGTDFQYPG
jgi:hypothetical protein